MKKPKRVWVVFEEGKLPTGVTRLRTEADAWRRMGDDIHEYVLAPVRQVRTKRRT